MSTPNIKTTQGNRHSGAAGQAPCSPRPALDVSWEAIVAQLRASPTGAQPDEPDAGCEYAWARRLGVHINRAVRVQGVGR